MGEREKAIEKKILLSLDENERLFRINAGMGWAGEVLRHEGGILTLGAPRPFRAAPDGWPDLCGWRTVEITPDMVGQRIAVFKGCEIKAPDSRGRVGKLHGRQKDFKRVIESMGGIFEVVEE